VATGNPTWYDVLGVEHDATPEQIKAAWRNATDKFEPGSGSGQFRMFNEAADVLLDPASRAAYDESLGAGPGVDLGKPVVEDEPSHPVGSSAGPSTHVDPKAERRRAREEKRARAAEEKGARQVTASGTDVPVHRASRRAGVLTAALAVLTVAALVVAGFFGLKVRTDSAVNDARDEAPATAEAAAKALLAYDYRDLPADRTRASRYLTASFRAKYLKNFSLLEKQKDGTPGAAVQTKTVVTSSVLGSGVMDAEDKVVRVLVYVDQTSKKPGKDPQIFQNRVAMTMKKQGSRWLVDDLKSY
jgi:Mce-associated membrane protein